MPKPSLCALLLLLLLSSCRTTAAPTPASATTPIPTPMGVIATAPATTLPILLPTVTPEAASNVSKLATVGANLVLTLPTGWQSQEVAASALGETLTTLQQQAADDSARTALGQIQSAVAPTSTVLVAWADDVTAAIGPTTLTLFVIPRYALSLQRYLDGIQTELAAVADVVVHTAQMDTGWRTDGLPVAVVHYTLAAPAIDGYQVALFDPKAEQLVVATFTTPTAQAATQLPGFIALLRTLQWK